MSEDLTFSGGQTGNNAQEYEERKRYLDYIRDSGMQLLDTLYEDKHYGFLNADYEVVYPNPSSAVNFDPPAAQVQTLNYVSTQFSRFREDFIFAANNLDYVTAPSTISNLTPTKGYVNMLEDYQTYQEITIEKIIFSLEQGDKAIPAGDYDMFIREVNKLIVMRQGLNDEYKITRSGYLLSKSSIPYYTGLYVNLSSDLSPNLDFEKGKMIQDPGFECYVSYASKHGFYVDANAPWRLVLNLNSEVTRRNIVNEKDRNFNDFYSNIYRAKAGYDDYHDLKTFYERAFLFYNIRRGITFDPSVTFANYNTDLMLESFVLIRMLEVGGITKNDLEQESSPAATALFNLQNQAKMRFRGIYKQSSRMNKDQANVSGNHGLSGYMNRVCANFIRTKLMKYRSNFDFPEITIEARTAEDFTTSTSRRRGARQSRE